MPFILETRLHPSLQPGAINALKAFRSTVSCSKVLDLGGVFFLVCFLCPFHPKEK